MSTPASAIAPAVFTFSPSFSVRIIMRDDAPWFVAKDIADALDYAWNASKTVSHVPDEWRGVESVSTPSGDQQMLVLSEQGLYFFLGRSDKPKALPFQKWLAGEVIPAIRKTGRYHAVPPAPTSDAAHEMLTAKDMGTLTRLVWMICNSLWGGSAWTQAVWFRLRQATGCAAPNRFHVRHLPILASEVRRIFCMVQAFKDASRESERLLIKRVLRGGEAEGPILEQTKQLMAEAVASDEAELGKLMARWNDAEVEALIERKGSYHGDHITAYAEPGAQ